MLLDIADYRAIHGSTYVEHTEPYVSKTLTERRIDINGAVRSVDLSMYGLELKLVDSDVDGYGDVSLRALNELGKDTMSDHNTRASLRSLNPEYGEYTRLKSGTSYAETLNSLHTVFPNSKTTITNLSDVLVVRVREDMVLRPFAESGGFRVLQSQPANRSPALLDDGSSLVFAIEDIYVYPEGNQWMAARMDTEGNANSPVSFNALQKALEHVQPALEDSNQAAIEAPNTDSASQNALLTPPQSDIGYDLNIPAY